MDEATFSGRLSKPLEMERGISAQISIGGDSISIHSNGQLLGEWSVEEVSLERSRGDRFRLVVEGESWTFVADEPEHLAFLVRSSLPQPSARDELPTGVSITSTGSTGSTDIPAWLRRDARAPFVTALGAVFVFIFGFASGRHVSTPTYVAVLACFAALAGAAWSWSRKRKARRRRTSSLNSPTVIVDGLPDPAEYEAVAKWIASGYLFNLVAWWRWATSPQKAQDEAGRSPAPAPLPAPAEQSTGTDNAQPLEPPKEPAAEVETPSVRSESLDDAGTPQEDHQEADTTSRVQREFLLALEPPSRVADAESKPRTGSTTGEMLPEKRGSLDPVVYRRVAAWLGDLRTATEGTLQDDSDDLRQIRGIGPVFAEALESLGYASFAEVATLDGTALDDLEALVGPVRRRMERDGWRESAELLHRAKYGEDLSKP